MGCNACRQSTPETFNLTTETGQAQGKPDDGPVVAAKTGNFGMVRFSF
jgi:ferredoxin